ncbi:protein gone early isoform X2 [Toxorhynchites rutilus septentrionalis]|uniref:protein gone early isoform X2 n=1 Tax=Toxorhynchites rutilus septentrionalis TaxID=329112 RepID=UPI002479F7DA|nr:protein gone early isoform X2 [Toxorhynchites rutilus septentrionalis]
MAEDATNVGVIMGGRSNGDDGDEPARRSNINGGSRFGSFRPVPISGPVHLISSQQGSPDSSADEEAKLLHKQNFFKTLQAVERIGEERSPEVESEGDIADNERENGDLKGRGDGGLGVSVIDIADSGGTQPYKSSLKGMKKNVFEKLYDRLLNAFDVSKKSERPFVGLILTTLVLLIVLIVLIIVWPRIPEYLTKEICVETECMEASKQILAWANPRANECLNPYEWACGRFEEDFGKHNFFEAHKGEWNFNTHLHYKDTMSTYEFIFKLPSVKGLGHTVKKLHAFCTSLDQTTTGDTTIWLKRVFRELGGSQLFPTSGGRGLSRWDLPEHLAKAQAMYGVSAFYKIGIDTRNEPPFDYILTLTEGDLGMPNKEYYALDDSHPISQAYRTYLRDIYTNLMASTSTKAYHYADIIYNYEKRLALTVARFVNDAADNATRPRIRKLSQVADDKSTRWLPINRTASAMFPLRITHDTPVLVDNPAVFKAITQVIQTTDIETLNHFVIWSVIQRYLPYMSSDLRQSRWEFDKVLYGVRTKPPFWHSCTELIQQWLPYGLEALRENPALIVPDSMTHPAEIDLPNPYHSSHLVTNEQHVQFDDELVKIMFYHVRDEYKQAVINADWINGNVSEYITDKLSRMRIQIGIPNDLLKSEQTLGEYYRELYMPEFLFMDNIVAQWESAKTTMNRLMGNVTEGERIIAELYPPIASGGRKAPVANMKYSISLNMVIISRQKLREPYFHIKYPLSLNFARLGSDISLVIQDAINTFAEQLKNIEGDKSQHFGLSSARLGNIFSKQAQRCVTNVPSVPKGTPKDRQLERIGNVNRLNLYLEVSSVGMLTRAFETLVEKIHRNERIFESAISEKTTYELLGLRERHLQPGLRKYSEQQLYALAYMQKHCAVASVSTKRLTRLQLVHDIPETEKFDFIWHHVFSKASSMQCGSSSTNGDGAQNGRCSRIL